MSIPPAPSSTPSPTPTPLPLPIPYPTPTPPPPSYPPSSHPRACSRCVQVGGGGGVPTGGGYHGDQVSPHLEDSVCRGGVVGGAQGGGTPLPVHLEISPTSVHLRYTHTAPHINTQRIWCMVSPLRVWSSITGRGGGATKWENRGSETFCNTPPPSRQGKTYCAPPFKGWKLVVPRITFAKTVFKLPQNLLCPPFSMA